MLVITKQINDAYEALDSSKTDAARRVGVTGTAFNFWLTGRSTPRDFIRRRMEREYGLDPGSLGVKATDVQGAAA
ncbi:hypothetical protein [Patulibacter sp.]|uniref:hypothetical protein n=1 Tax=Patulibacter sp. TaxID=1912859 RepID=UPI002719D78B|nr:hypothetical protein [Patulibacter sp.]MDO9409691.1 hypothetical protein [Patulibacter sp.]